MLTVGRWCLRMGSSSLPRLRSNASCAQRARSARSFNQLSSAVPPAEAVHVYVPARSDCAPVATASLSVQLIFEPPGSGILFDWPSQRCPPVRKGYTRRVSSRGGKSNPRPSVHERGLLGEPYRTLVGFDPQPTGRIQRLAEGGRLFGNLLTYKVNGPKS
jgi:hypothetical protein